MGSEYNATPDDHTNTVVNPRFLDTAYDALLESRDTLFSSDEVPELSEEDKLCNQNLQTSYLFKSLNVKYIELNSKIEDLTANEKSLDEAIAKFKNSHSTITTLCMAHDSHSTSTIHAKYLDMASDYNRIQGTIKKEILLKRAALESELDKISIKLNSIRKLIQMGVEDIVKPEDMNKKMCPVCFDKEVCMVMIPCGHTYCEACSRYDYRAKCPQCRATINSRVKMYFSI